MAFRIVIINSKYFSGQNANDLTVDFDEPFQGVKSMELKYIGIPQTFYNISDKIKNNTFLAHNGIGPASSQAEWLTIPDGFYDFSSFRREFGAQLNKIQGLSRHSIRFDIQEPTGKIIMHFQTTRGSYSPSLFVTKQNDDLLGIKRGRPGSLQIPQSKDETTVIGDKPVNFKPFEYFFIHCDLIDKNDVFFNEGKSDILASLPIKDSDFGAINQYSKTGVRKCIENFNRIKLWITDENNKLIDLNYGNVQYEILFNLNE